jgi:hypothetical protein
MLGARPQNLAADSKAVQRSPARATVNSGGVIGTAGELGVAPGRSSGRARCLGGVERWRPVVAEPQAGRSGDDCSLWWRCKKKRARRHGSTRQRQGRRAGVADATPQSTAKHDFGTVALL